MNVRRTLLSSVAVLGVLMGAGAAAAQQSSGPGDLQVITADARSSLSAGYADAGVAVLGMELVNHTPHAPGFGTQETMFSPAKTPEERAAMRAANEGNHGFSALGTANSDMAVSNGKLFVGNFNGFNAYDITGAEPRLVMSVVCPGGQGDVSVHGNLLFMSVEENRGKLDCSGGGNAEDVSAERFRGVRIFDISDLNNPHQVAAVQTCRGSHTHTLLPDPSDRNVLYVYGQGTSDVRETGELDICTDGEPDVNPETALFSIDVIKVPLDRPQDAALVNRPRIFADATTGQVAGLWRGGRAGLASQDTAQTNQCHDITVFPEIGLAGGACSGNGILLDISDPENPKRTSDVFDPDMSYWHSATFNNAGDKVVFTDEWGGGIGARCQATDPATWGANMVATIADRTLTPRSFHKLPSAQGATENCVAHNGNIIPVPGRDLMVQSWYQGGVSVMDFTDPMKPVEIAYFDRGPISAERLYVGGSWSAYWFNGRVYSSEIARGLDVIKLIPSDQLSAAEISAAEAIMVEEINPQLQTRVTWTDTPDVAAAYVDQLARTDAIEDAVETRVRGVIDGWRSGSADKAAAGALSTELATAPEDATDATKARLTALSALLGRIAA